MSKFTGKADFADVCEMHYNHNQILHAKVYMENALINFKNDFKNVIPYYPHIVASMAASKEVMPIKTGVKNSAGDEEIWLPSRLDLSINLKKNDYFDDREETAKAIALNDLVYKIQKSKKRKVDYKDRAAFIDAWKDQPLAPVEKAIYEKSTDEQLDFLASLKVKFNSKSLNTYWAVYKALANEMYYSVKVQHISEMREKFYNYCVEQGVPEDNPKFRDLKIKVELAKRQ